MDSLGKTVGTSCWPVSAFRSPGDPPAKDTCVASVFPQSGLLRRRPGADPNGEPHLPDGPRVLAAAPWPPTRWFDVFWVAMRQRGCTSALRQPAPERPPQVPCCRSCRIGRRERPENLIRSVRSPARPPNASRPFRATAASSARLPSRTERAADPVLQRSVRVECDDRQCAWCGVLRDRSPPAEPPRIWPGRALPLQNAPLAGGPLSV